MCDYVLVAENLLVLLTDMYNQTSHKHHRHFSVYVLLLLLLLELFYYFRFGIFYFHLIFLFYFVLFLSTFCLLNGQFTHGSSLIENGSKREGEKMKCVF